MWKLPINAEGERKHLLPKIRCVKNLEMLQWNSCRQKPDEHPGFEETGEG